MVLTRSMGKPLNAQAALLHGKVNLVELALRSAAQNGGVLNVSHRVPFDDLSRRAPGAILTFIPPTIQEHASYGEYIKYFGGKQRAGVIKLDDNDSLYIVPPCPEALPLISALEASGSPEIPKTVLLGVIAASPGPAGGALPGKAAGAPPGDAPAATAAAEPATASKPAEQIAEPKKAEAVLADPEPAPKVEAAAAPVKDTGDKPTDGGDDDDGPQLSQDALLDLFSNPDLIQSLSMLEESTE